jgi:putative flippase GtrA
VSLVARLALQWSTLAIQREFARFFVVGVAAAVGHYGTLVAAVELGGASPVLAAMCGFLVGGSISYGLNRSWTFGSDRAHEAAVPRFAIVAFIGFLLTGAFMALLTGPLGLHYLLAQVTTTGLVMIWTFLGHRHWTFRASRP